ncbi:MAG: M3 family metallopeptidase [Pseudomonadota bacterium]
MPPSTTQDAFPGLPDFDSITATDIVPLTEALIARSRERVQALEALESPDFDNFVVPFEELRHDVSRTWSPVSHLQMVRNSETWQAHYLEALGLLAAFQSELAQNTRLFTNFEALHDALDEDADHEQRALLEHALRDFRLAGVALNEDDKARFRALSQALSEDQASFSSNLQQSGDAWQWATRDADAVAGIPDTFLATAARAAEQAGQDGWLFDLAQPTYIAVMTHARARDTRKRFYTAWLTRAADTGPHDVKWDNAALMARILGHRTEMAGLLGFDNYAEYSLAPKMAGSVDEVVSFLKDLAQRSLPTARRELAELQLLAGHELAPWDLAFFSERLREQHYAISEEQVRPYFPAGRVMDGLFGLAERLFGLSLERNEAPSVWHDSVEFIVVRDAGGEIMGSFYTDLYARAGKRAGAWIDECIVRKALPGSSALPVGYLVCNFPPEQPDAPSLLTHDEVVTLFHEFGHMLHHLLTRVGYPSIAGINGVPWDAVELPSQFLENFAWQFDVLRQCSGHYQDGTPLPRVVFDRLAAARNAGAGLSMLRQLEFSLFDFQLHARSDAAESGVLETVRDSTRAEVALVPPPEWVRFENGFAHIFAGGYAAGYYSYKWAEVLAADAFAAFDEAGDVFDPGTAGRFRQHILEVGGSRDIHHAYVAFRGRTPRIDALLQQHGIEAA